MVAVFETGGLETGDLAGGFKHFLFSPRKLGKISILTHIFQMGGPTANQRLDDIFFLGLEKKRTFGKTAEDFCWTHFFFCRVYSLYNSMYKIAIILYIYIVYISFESALQ